MKYIGRWRIDRKKWENMYNGNHDGNCIYI